MTIYMVTGGQYSNYRVLGVYSTRELAEKAKKIWNSENDITEWTVDDMPDAPQGLLGWKVSIAENGDVDELERLGLDDMREEVGLYLCWHPPHLKDYRADFHVWARDALHAVKIVSEMRREMIVDGRWAAEFKEARKRQA